MIKNGKVPGGSCHIKHMPYNPAYMPKARTNFGSQILSCQSGNHHLFDLYPQMKMKFLSRSSSSHAQNQSFFPPMSPVMRTSYDIIKRYPQHTFLNEYIDRFHGTILTSNLLKNNIITNIVYMEDKSCKGNFWI